MNASAASFSEFTDQEIREQLQLLGFKNISNEKFSQFKRDLEKLISQEISMNTTAASDISCTPVRYSTFNQKLANIDNEFEAQRPARANGQKKVTFPSDSQIVIENSTPMNNTSELDESFVSTTTTTSSIVDNRVMKRKVRRKAVRASVEEQRQDQEEEEEGEQQQQEASHLNEDKLAVDLRNMNLQSSPTRTLDDTLRDFDDDVDEDEEELRVQSDDEQLIRINNCYAPINYPIKSFIRSQSSLSLRSDCSRLSVKSNPVQRYQAYQQSWNKYKAPGEKKHNNLRWSIREQMLVKDVIYKKQQHSYVPNTYVIPTEKKRQKLRWIVRSALANPT